MLDIKWGVLLSGHSYSRTYLISLGGEVLKYFPNFGCEDMSSNLKDGKAFVAGTTAKLLVDRKK